MDLGLLDAHDFLRLLPQPLEVVTCALLESEEMHDDVPHIQQHPAAIGVAFLAEAIGLTTHCSLGSVDERLHLSLIVHRRNDEVVRERGQRGQVEHHHIGRLAIDQYVHNAVREFRSLQAGPPDSSSTRSRCCG